MNQPKYQQYRDWASMLWLVGALLVALAVSLFLQASRRETLFYIVFIVGCTVLLRLNQRRNIPEAKPSVAVAPAQDLVQKLLDGDKLTPEAGRAWLDQLLVEQQQEEQK